MIVMLTGILLKCLDGMKEIFMRSLCHTKIKSLKEYMEMEPSRIYVCDLNHFAPILIKEAKESNIPIYGSAGRKPRGTWISVCATGMNQPTTY